MTVEIIIASVIAFSIAFFLMEITIKLVDISDNEYVNTNFITDKALIMKNIKENIRNDIGDYGKVKTISCNNNNNNNICSIKFSDDVTRELIVDNANFEVKYKENSGSVLYSKKISDGLSNVSLSGNIVGNYVYFQIKGDNIFSNEIYDINIVVYNG